MAGGMLELSSTSEVIASFRSAKKIYVEAYTLHGPIVRALENAAGHGAHVVVQLDGAPFDDPKGSFAKENARLAAQLREAGAEAILGHPLHAKEIEVEGTLYLDGKNWGTNDIVLRDDDAAEAASIPTTKPEALALEARLLEHASKRDQVVVESESFGSGNAAYAALKALALAGGAPRLLVSERDLRSNDRERHILESLVRDGVRVRVCSDSEKLAVACDRAWLGSANATVSYGDADMTDWGLCTANAGIVNAVRTRLELEWKAARTLGTKREVREAVTDGTSCSARRHLGRDAIAVAGKQPVDSAGKRRLAAVRNCRDTARRDDALLPRRDEKVRRLSASIRSKP
jgi:hypothetical protein